jgi:hypothetical protein
LTKTVDEGFREFLIRLTPTWTETDAATQHRASIAACLKVNFQMTNFFRTGSFGFGTSIYGFSDVDYFAVIPPHNLKHNSSASLQEMRTVLDYRFPYTGVRVKTPAVVIPFGTDGSETTEVVPSHYIESDNNDNGIYGIPNSSGGWMRASPAKHKAWINAEDTRLLNKVKPLIRFIKAWKYYQNVPICSFYLELRVTEYASKESAIVYSIDVKNVLKRLLNGQLAAIQDPMGISGYIDSCSTDNFKKDALSKLETAVSRAEKAYDSERTSNIGDAFYWWSLLFNETFPSYY